MRKSFFSLAAVILRMLGYKAGIHWDGLRVEGENWKLKLGDITLEMLANERRRSNSIKDLKNRVVGLSWEWRF